MDYGVSYEVAVYHLNSLRYVDRTAMYELLRQNSLAMKYVEVVGLRPSEEPGSRPDGSELHSQIMHLALEAYRREEISRGRLLDVGRRLNIDPKDLIDLLDSAHLIG